MRGVLLVVLVSLALPAAGQVQGCVYDFERSVLSGEQRYVCTDRDGTQSQWVLPRAVDGVRREPTFLEQQFGPSVSPRSPSLLCSTAGVCP